MIILLMHAKLAVLLQPINSMIQLQVLIDAKHVVLYVKSVQQKIFVQNVLMGISFLLILVWMSVLVIVFNKILLLVLPVIVTA